MIPKVKLALEEVEKQTRIEESLLKRLDQKFGPQTPMKILEMIIDNKIPNGWIIR